MRSHRLEVEDIVRAGREVGLRDLSLNAVAGRLGVSSTALYRHLDGRWQLERLVGESILAELTLVDDPRLSVIPHLLSTAMQLREQVLDNPGLAEYLQTLFPRGEGGRKLLVEAAEGLQRRGYRPDAAVVLCSAVASITIGFAAAEDAQRRREGLEDQRQGVVEDILTDPRLSGIHLALPEVGPEEYVRMWLGAAIRGIVEAAPPESTLTEIRAALHAAGEER